MSQTRNSVLFAARFVIVALCAVGLIGVAPIAYQQMTGAAPCPALGPVPACYLVLLGYALMGVSVFVGAGSRTALFAAGCIPVFGLALFGSSMEAFGYETCPRNENNTPTCFFSLAIAVGLIVAFLVQRLYGSRTK